MNAVNRKLPAGFTLLELLIVVAIISLLISILYPAGMAAWRLAQRMRCGTHLRSITLACRTYAAEHKGRWPNAFTRESTRADELPAEPNPAVGLRGANTEDDTRGTDNKEAVVNSNSASLWLLVSGGYVPAQIFLCPAAGDTPDNIRNPKEVRDFLSRQHCSYSYQCRLGNRRILDTWKLAVAADRSPFFDPHQATDNPEANSFNHEGDGQNVAFADGHVDWTTKACCDETGDWFYRAWTAANDETPDEIPGPEAAPRSDLDALLR